MDDHSSLNEQPDSPLPAESASYTGAFFPRARHFVVAGGTFTSNTITEVVPSVFLRVPLGSVDLHNEIPLDGARGVVRRNHVRGSVRRMYSARVVGHNEPMTVAVYQGDNTEQEWKRDLLRYSNLRHPYIFQLYATASSSGIHASIFHGDLIPFEQFLKSFSDSVILQAYVKAYSSRDYFDAYMSCKALMSASQHRIFWIRRSTGRLCIELNRPDMPVTVSLGTERIPPPPPGSIVTFHDPNRESLIVDSLGLSQWYSICSTHLAQRRTSDVSARAEVKLGAIVYWPSGSRLEDTTEIASATYPHFNCLGWYRSRLGRSKNNTARCNLADVINSIISLAKYHDPRRIPWLSVANYIFNEHQIVSNRENYVLVDWVEFTLQISAATRNPPDGYLFLCSPADFDSGPTSFRWPDCPAYWSLDPSGASRLSTEEASSLGFPCMKLRTEVSGTYWDEAVYAAVRKFHVGKGFDPESQDIARELGYPLFAVSVPISDEFAPEEFLELIKFGLIVALALVSLFEYLGSVL